MMKQSSMNLCHNIGHMILASTAFACNVLSRNASYKFANTGARGCPHGDAKNLLESHLFILHDIVLKNKL